MCGFACPDRAHRNRAARMLLLHLLPARVGIEAQHVCGERRRWRAEVLLVYDAILIDDERHDARGTPSGRIRHEREAAHHPRLGDVVVRAALRMRTLRGEDAVVVAVVRLLSVSLRMRLRDERAERTGL